MTLVVQNNEQNYGNIYIGSLDALDQSLIQEKKITAFITITKNFNVDFPFEDYNFNLCLPIEKNDAQILSNYLLLSLKFLEKHQSKTNILVFCSDGNSLSPIIIMAYLMKFFNYEFIQAYESFSLNRTLLDKTLISQILIKLFPNIRTNPINEQIPFRDRTNIMNSQENKEKKPVGSMKSNIKKEITHTNMFTKVHSIESYHKNVEPELKFEDINCIINSNENNTCGIYLGNLNAAKNLHLLRELNISAVLTVAEELELSYNNDQWPVAHLKIMASDVENFDLSRFFEKCFSFINKFQGNTNVLIHCYAGVSRSVTITLAYLMKFYRMSFKKALSLVREKRKQIYPNSGFINQLKSYEKMLAWEQRKVQTVLA